MQKFLILGLETFAWNSSHRRGSGPQTQTQTVDSFRRGTFKLFLNNVDFLQVKGQALGPLRLLEFQAKVSVPNIKNFCMDP